jgi:zinc transport system substrate-binding protein
MSTQPTRSLRALAALAIAGAVLLGMTACAEPADDGASEEAALTVATSVPPMGWLAERIGGESVDVIVMTKPGEDPHTYEPSPADMRAMGDADAYVTVDLEFEDVWVPRFTEASPDMVVVDAAADVAKLADSGEDEHSEGTDDHSEEDPHVWTSLKAMAVMGHTLAAELAVLDPDNADAYTANARTLEADITKLDVDISAALASSESMTFMVFHPAWGYFARDYDLEQMAVESGGQEPSAAELATLIDSAREEGISVIFVQPSSSTRTADLIAEEIGAEVVVVNPLAEDWLANMQQVASAFEEALN